ncbi:FIST N-terminal domain-containing protein [Caminibacter profundus]
MISLNVYKTLSKIKVKKGEKYILFLTEEFLNDLPKIQEKFINTDFKGAIIPYFILNNKLINKGIAVLKFNKKESYSLIVSMKEFKEKEYLLKNKRKSFFIFVDGLSEYFEHFIDSLNEFIDENTYILGGGVGYKNLLSKPTIFDKNGIYKDHALIIGTNFKISIGISHGWKPIYGPLVVTKAKNNIIYELNNEKAFDVYQKIIYDIENVEIKPDDFYSIAMKYPFGISNFFNEEYIIRDPIQVKSDKSLQIVSSVKEMDTLYIMKGEKENLINSTCDMSKKLFTTFPTNESLIIDCISRVLFLQDAFEKEIEAVYNCSENNNLKLFGFTSIGEITNYGQDKITIFNKTTLLGNFNE